VTSRLPLRVAGRRVTELALLTLAISLTTFALLTATKGDVATAAVRATGEPVTPDRVAAKQRELGLDAPAPERYARMVGDAVRGDLGLSVRTGRPVTDDLAPRLRPTLLLAAAGSAVATGFALLLALAEVAVRRRPVAGVLRGLSLVLVSVPGFALAFLLVAVLSLRLGWLPTGGTGSGRSLVLPALVLGLPAGAALGRVLAARLRAALEEPYLVTARAQGHGPLACLLRVALPNAGVTSLVVGGNIVAGVVSGTLVVEELFGWPGAGAYLVDALRYRDWYPLQAAVLLLAALVIGVRALSLAAAALLDPRAGVDA
jgi:peptide/nickel transport system permease protein